MLLVNNYLAKFLGFVVEKKIPYAILRQAKGLANNYYCES